MKKKSTSQSAFFYWRVSIGLLLGVAGVSLALLGIGQFSAHAQPQKSTINFPPELVPPLFDCSQFYALGLDKQENFRAGAIAIYCGLAQGGAPTDEEGNPLSIAQQVLGPLSGGVDINLITPGPETGQHITQSETFVGTDPGALHALQKPNLFAACEDIAWSADNLVRVSLASRSIRADKAVRAPEPRPCRSVRLPVLWRGEQRDSRIILVAPAWLGWQPCLQACSGARRRRSKSRYQLQTMLIGGAMSLGVTSASARKTIALPSAPQTKPKVF